MDYQTLFNVVAGALLVVVAATNGYILNQINHQFLRMDKRIDEIKKDHVSSARDSRLDNANIKASMPNDYVPRREHEATQKAIRDDIGDLKKDVRELDRLIRSWTEKNSAAK